MMQLPIICLKVPLSRNCFFLSQFFFLHKIVCLFSSQICPFCCHKIVFLVTKLIVFWVNSVRSDNPNPNLNRKLAPVYFSGLLVKESTTDQNNGLQYLQHKDLFIFLFLIPSFHQTFAQSQCLYISGESDIIRFVS